MCMKSNWNKRFSRAIEAYKKAVYALAEVVEEGSTEYGRDRVVDMTCLEEKRVNYLNNLARLSYVDKSQMPELCYECVNVSKPKSWLEKAKKENWKPSQLRKHIRANQKLFKKEKPVEIALWPKYSVLLENELNKLTPEQREVAIQRLKQSLKL